MRPTDRLLALSRRQGSTRSLGLLRICLALLVYTRWAHDFQLFREWQPNRIDMPTGAFIALSIGLYLSTGMMLVGAFSRVATALAGASTLAIVIGVGHLLGHEPYTHHHTWALALGVALLALTPCGGSFSLDRWWALRRADRAGQPPPTEQGELWALPLLGLHVSAIYLYGTWAKLTPGYLSGARMQHYLMTLYTGSDLPQGLLADALIQLSTWGSILIEPLLAIGLWIPRLRRWLLPVGLLFHGFIYWSLPVGTFSMTIAALYLAFLDPDASHRAIDRLLGWGRPG